MGNLVHKNGAYASPTYITWRGMKLRCDNPKNASYKNYGAKGISYCERWKIFANFLEDMGVRPEGLTLDRIDPSKDYEPGNCRWLSMKDQIRSRRIALLFDGKPLAELAEESGIAYGTVWRRIKVYGWSLEDALNRPSHRHSRPQPS